MTAFSDHDDQDDRPTDVELIELYRDHHDLDAITALIRRYDAALRSMVRRILHHDEDAADVVQATWVSVLTALGRPEFEIHGMVHGWLWNIARHAAIDQLRRRRTRPTTGMPSWLDLAATGDDYAAADARIVLDALFDTLPARYCEAITLVWLRGLSVQEAADVLGIAAGTVKSRCARARTYMGAAVRRSGLITTSLDPD